MWGQVKAWLDDFAIYDRTEIGLLDALEKFLRICTDHNLFLSATKSSVFTRTLRWCGYIIDADGCKCDSRLVEALREGHEPTNAAELSQFINCLQWMSQFIPDFENRSSPLREILEQAYKISKKRTIRSVRGIPLRSLG